MDISSFPWLIPLLVTFDYNYIKCSVGYLSSFEILSHNLLSYGNFSSKSNRGFVLDEETSCGANS
jgi:hypothetical protein